MVAWEASSRLGVVLGFLPISLHDLLHAFGDPRFQVFSCWGSPLCVLHFRVWYFVWTLILPFLLLFPCGVFFLYLFIYLIQRRLMTCYKLQQVLYSFLLLWRTSGSVSWKKLIKIILVLVPNSTHKQNQKSGLQVWFLKHTHLGFWILWFGCDCLWLMFWVFGFYGLVWLSVVDVYWALLKLFSATFSPILWGSDQCCVCKWFGTYTLCKCKSHNEIYLHSMQM
jgi:hypothetical protein